MSQPPTPPSNSIPSMDAPQQRESRVMATVALVAVGVLYAFLPDELQVGPSSDWLPLAIITVLSVSMWTCHLRGLEVWNQRLGYASLVVLAGFLTASLLTILFNLEGSNKGYNLLKAGVMLWVSNILLFASVYWRLDAGGPNLRRKRKQHFEGAAFLFPQMTMPGGQGSWQPHFIDYLFLAFNTSTAFSPTDTPTLTPWAKVAMMVQSLISLGTVALVVARAVNVIPTGS